MKYQPPKGTQDLWGQKLYVYDNMAKIVLKVTERYGFRQIRTPGFESIAILNKDAGSELTSQIYTFVDKGGRELGIKSDLTPSIARFVAGNGRPMPKPIKIVCYDRVYRYESPQSGRNREITQINGEMFGVRAGLADAEVIACLYQCYAELGLPEAVVTIGYRRLLVDYIRALGVDEAQVLPLVRLIDKKDKVSAQDFAKEATALGLSKAALAKIWLLLDLEGPFVPTLKKARQVCAANATFLPYIEELEPLCARLQDYGIAKQCRLNLGLARGSDYYTGVIFEVKLPGTRFGSIGGGGRYDNLVASYGGPEMPAVGWSIGLDRMYLVLEELGRLEPLAARPQINYYVATERDVASTKAALTYTQRLRAKGQNVEIDLKNKNLSEQLQAAKELGARQVIIFKQNAVKDGKAALLNPRTGIETMINFSPKGKAEHTGHIPPARAE